MSCNESVFGLITQLCEKYSKNHDQIKKLRAKSYAILLGKVQPRKTQKFTDIKSSDPICNLYAWQYVLDVEYHMKETAENLVAFSELGLSLFEETNQADQFKNILQFLLSLRSIPSIDDTQKVHLLPRFNEINYDEMFKLPESLKMEVEAKAMQFSFNFNPHKKVSVQESASDTNVKKIENEPPADEGYNSFSNESLSIWEIAAHATYRKYRNWENFGLCEPDKEPRFISELGDLSSLWVDNIPTLTFSKPFTLHKIIITSQIKGLKHFINDLKYLAVGMTSESFTLNNAGQFFLIPGTRLETITENVIENYSRDIIFAGHCFKALQEISIKSPSTNKYKRDGFIFAEFCDKIRNYLNLFRTAVFALPEKLNLIGFKVQTETIRSQIKKLALICKVGPFFENNQFPSGVALICYLYENVQNLGNTDKNMVQILYGMLYPCCQVYICRFLQPWVLNGSFDDPYNEFFIAPDPKFVKSKGRTYWTRGFHIREDLIPDFLTDLKEDILKCGRAMNLLKMCFSNSKLVTYLMGKKSYIISSCVSHEQLENVHKNSNIYYYEVLSQSGPIFSLSQIFKRMEENDHFLNLVAKKQAATLRRIELEREAVFEAKNRKKQAEHQLLKKQYDEAMKFKHYRILKEIEQELKSCEDNLYLEKLRDKLLKEESQSMIEYYEKLYKISDLRKFQIDKNIELMKNYSLEFNRNENILTAPEETTTTKDNVSLQNEQDESLNSFKLSEKEQSLNNINEPSSKIADTQVSPQNEDGTSHNRSESTEESFHSTTSTENTDLNAKNLDELNGNTNTDDINKNSAFKETYANFEAAKRNKQKVLSQELGIQITEHPTIIKTTDNSGDYKNLTDAQKNKLKVLSSEFDIKIAPTMIMKTDHEITNLEINRFRNTKSSACFTPNYEKLDNASYVNKNITPEFKKSQSINIPEETAKQTSEIKKSMSLNLKPLPETESIPKCVPMSIDSTPSPVPEDTPIIEVQDGDCQDSDSCHSFKQSTDDETLHNVDTFTYSIGNAVKTVNFSLNLNNSEPLAVNKVGDFSREVTYAQACQTGNVERMYLTEGVATPLRLQLKLVQSEILKFFVSELNFLEHLRNLRDFFFLQDGEFAKHLTESLFNKLYSVKLPQELLNCRTLYYFLFGPFDAEKDKNLSNLSFKINSIPEVFNLRDPDVLKCLSVTYNITWPLNIVIPKEIISKYEEVFKFLVKLSRISYVLKEINMDLKLLAKKSGKKEMFIMVSPQFRAVHQYRFVITHFIQCLQNYVNSEVFQSNWAVFEKELASCDTIDRIYEAHVKYLKTVLQMCFLTQKTLPVRKVFDKIFTVVLKFYDHLRSRSWVFEDGALVHPNFDKLDQIYKNYNEFVLYLFKMEKKVRKSGSQGHFVQLLEMIDFNEFYTSNDVDTVN